MALSETEELELLELEHEKSGGSYSVLKDYIKSEEKLLRPDEIISLIQDELKKIPKSPKIIERIIEKQIIKEEKRDSRKFVEEKVVDELKEEIKRLNKSLEEFKQAIPMMLAQGGSGVIGLPNPSGQGGKFVTTDGSVIKWATGGGGATSLHDLTDVDDSAKQSGYALLYNGTQWVAAAQGTSFSFSITSFSDGFSSAQEIGASGVWKAIGAISFSASYSNGPATAGAVSFAGWGSSLNLTNSFQGPTTNAEAVNYPTVSGTVVFSLNASNASGSGSSSITHTFVNRRYWGVSTKSSGFNASDVSGLANNELVDSRAKSFTVSPGSGEYIIYSYPTRLGTATFTAGGFEGGFNPPETVSITNASGYVENYYVYSSINSNLGTTNVVVS